MSMTNKHPAYSWPGILLAVLEKPFLVFVDRTSRSLCRLRHWLICPAEVYCTDGLCHCPSQFEWRKNQQRSWTNRSELDEGSCPDNLQLCHDRCKPNRTLSNAVYRYCWDIACRNVLVSKQLVDDVGFAMGETAGLWVSKKKVGHSHARQSCATLAVRDLKCPQRPSWPSVSSIMNEM